MEAWRKELYLVHHGVKGQRWGVRRYQNYDGSLISVGEKTKRRRNSTAHLTYAKQDATTALSLAIGSMGVSLLTSSLRGFVSYGYTTVDTMLGLVGGIGSMGLKAVAVGKAVSAGYHFMKS